MNSHQNSDEDSEDYEEGDDIAWEEDEGKFDS
jgi:hypothetical protein